MKESTRLLVTIALLGSGALLAGCTAEDTAPNESPPATTDASTASPAGQDGETQVMTAESDLGTILVDGEGMALYLFTQDSPGETTCFDECLAAWPALTGEATAGEGADEAKLGSIEREDGTIQTTYDEWPLYYYVEDAESGDLKGQGLNDVWYVLSPDGEAITSMPESDSPGRGGY